MKSLIVIIVFFLALVSCTNDVRKERSLLPVSGQEEDFTFIKVNKDTSFFCNYAFHHEKGGEERFNYNSKQEAFTLIYDSLKKEWLHVIKNDTSKLELEQERSYTINNNEFKVYKLIEDKGITDGELSYFIDVKLGLLIVKSNTWRSSLFIQSRGANDNDLVLSALMFRILTDKDFYRNKSVSSDIDFTPPVLEEK
jgi:hypothetical protein